MVGADPDKRRVYLCHLYCELGATPAKSAFGKIHDWLRVNQRGHHPRPGGPRDGRGRRRRPRGERVGGPGLRLVAQGSSAPTLRQLIETKKNVIVMAENNGGAVRNWYHAAYDQLLQDTPYEFLSVEELAEPAPCAPGRGQAEHAAPDDQPLARYRRVRTKKPGRRGQ